MGFAHLFRSLFKKIEAKKTTKKRTTELHSFPTIDGENDYCICVEQGWFRFDRGLCFCWIDLPQNIYVQNVKTAEVLHQYLPFHNPRQFSCAQFYTLVLM